MMRLRLASVIATLSLLAWAATASAECAWVLWDATDTAMNDPAPHVRNWSWVTKGTYPTRHDCYLGMRKATLVKELKDLTDEALELDPAGDPGETMTNFCGTGMA